MSALEKDVGPWVSSLAPGAVESFKTHVERQSSITAVFGYDLTIQAEVLRWLTSQLSARRYEVIFLTRAVIPQDVQENLWSALAARFDQRLLLKNTPYPLRTLYVAKWLDELRTEKRRLILVSECGADLQHFFAVAKQTLGLHHHLPESPVSFVMYACVPPPDFQNRIEGQSFGLYGVSALFLGHAPEVVKMPPKVAPNVLHESLMKVEVSTTSAKKTPISLASLLFDASGESSAKLKK